ncbi:MAG: DUF4276 family protein, partial [Egibacteraceae bacterium]
MRCLEVLVEEQSAAEALGVLIPKILGNDVYVRIHPFRGKPDLPRKLPDRLRGYARSLQGTDTRIAVLIDEDRQDCKELKARLEDAAARAGLVTKTAADAGQPFIVLNRLAIEELEAWFFGDCGALRTAYPRVPKTVERQARFRQPDAIRGGTCEQLERTLRNAGYYPSGLPKIAVARQIAQ